MKRIYLLLSASLLSGIMSCNKESDLFDELSTEDELAIEGMEEAYATAKTYNDSLVWCSDTSNNCHHIFKAYCDSIFHSNDETYAMHHNNYSHNNMDDDHHHSMMNEHHHGNTEHHNDSVDEHHVHNQNSHNEMNELREHHIRYHPL